MEKNRVDKILITSTVHWEVCCAIWFDTRLVCTDSRAAFFLHVACETTMVADWFAILRKLVSTSTDSVVSVILSWIIVHVVTVVAVAAIVLAGVAVSLAILRVTRCLAVAIAIVAVAIAVAVVADAIVATVVTVAVVTVVARTIVTGGSDSVDVIGLIVVDGQDLSGLSWGSILCVPGRLGFSESFILDEVLMHLGRSDDGNLVFDFVIHVLR